MITLFISDIHLNPKRPKITQVFLEFLRHEAVKAQALYILGDFFDSWIGDDAMDDFENHVAQALHGLVDKGVKVYLMPGNRDFLYGEVFAQKSGVVLIPDPICIDLYGTPTLLVHGDGLCSEDRMFQLYRRFVRSPITQFIFLQMPLVFRKKIAQFLREKSVRSNLQKPAYLMDVAQMQVEEMMREYGVRHLIHGHTHDPKVVEFKLDGIDATRTVLGAWENDKYVLEINKR